MSKSYAQTCDTNVVQALYILKHVPEKIPYLEKHYSAASIIELKILSKNLHPNCSLFITPQVMKEVELCEPKLPGIVDFARRYFNLRLTLSGKVANDIVELVKAYFEEDIYLPDGTREAQSALIREKKNGELDMSDAEIVSENNAMNGFPLFSLNEKHMIINHRAQDQNKQYRSMAILKKNNQVLHRARLHKVTAANLKKLTATTFKVSDINKKKYYLETLMHEKL